MEIRTGEYFDGFIDTVERTAVNRIFRLGLLGILLLTPTWSHGQTLTAVEAFLGSAFNFPLPLTIQQQGYDDIEFTARYDTRGFSEPLYWAARLSFQYQLDIWELQLIHHKIYLTNPPDEIQHFEITHGFNIITLSRRFETKTVPFRFGAGFVLAHPSSRIRGLGLEEGGGIWGTGYRLTGPALLAGAGKRFPIAGGLFVALEGQLIGAYARVPVGNGHANAPNISVHGLVGVGYGL
jgi:hypothetical protein